MNITAGSKTIADVTIRSVDLRAVLGAYELVFAFSCKINPFGRDHPYEAVVSTARIKLTNSSGTAVSLGIGRPSKAIVLSQTEYVQPSDFDIVVPLAPYQVEALEAVRGGGGLNFSIELASRGGVRTDRPNWDGDSVDQLFAFVEESAWVKVLNQSGADQILIFEVRLANSGEGAPMDPAAQQLLAAQRHFIRGNWRECVASCRQVGEELLRHMPLGKYEFPNGTSRTAFSKDERLDFMAATLQHYGHLAAHSETKAGEMNYKRADARMALTVAAALVTRKFAVTE